MTQPRRHLAGQVVLLTRRCFQRRFLLRPDHFINRVLFYEVARASTRHDQSVHAFMAMSNHIHQVSTDTTGDRSEYMRDAMREIARSRNRHLKRRDSLWDGRPFGNTATLDRDTMERLNPRFASKNAKLLSRATDLHYDVLNDYQRQRLKWLKGKNVKFPCGTVELRKRGPIRCRPPDDDEPGLFKSTRSIG